MVYLQHYTVLMCNTDMAPKLVDLFFNIHLFPGSKCINIAI